jgi:secondary thiamine-phosphate synthase enzyme
MLTLSINTTRRVEMLDITAQIAAAIRNSGVSNGLATLFVPHTTAAVTINENADPDVQRDMVMALNKLIPFEDGYRHREGNSAAHLKCSLVGASETIIIHNGNLQLGSWQGIYFCEFDGPRRRQLHIQVHAG